MESDCNKKYGVLQGTVYYNVLQSTGVFWGLLGVGVTETKQNFFIFNKNIYVESEAYYKHILFIVLHYFHGQK